MKRSEIYLEAADRLNGMRNIQHCPFFFQAFPGSERTYEDARDFVRDFIAPGDGDIPRADPDVRVLFLCLMAAIAEDDE